MQDTIECRKCGELCQVDGEFPKFFAWCDTCNDYADYDMSEYTADHLATKIDAAYERKQEEKMERREVQHKADVEIEDEEQKQKEMT